MQFGRYFAKTVLIASSLSLAACSGGNLFGGGQNQRTADGIPVQPPRKPEAARQSSFFDLFGDKDNPNTTVEVNKYLWNASLDVLSFMPVQSADPFTGVLVFGYGTPPGGGSAYRATVHVSDPALDARGLRVALQTRGGRAVSNETQHKVEDAILARARQLRIQDINL